MSIYWDALSASYDDCVAWIQIPAVEISYPVMQAEDNDYYLHRSPDGNYIYAGSIFMDYQNDSYLEDYNTVIYGHNMRDGSMFAKLKQFRDSEVLVFCPYFGFIRQMGTICTVSFRFILSMLMATAMHWNLMDMRGIRNGFMRCWTLLK
ncbi:MAG: class B sortase [Clostridiales bacterium]|nr:class B sortase [Clostridiales bacterium]